MSEMQSTPKKFQWKWVGISLLMYIVFYFLPLTLVPGGMFSGTIVTKASATFIGVWSFAGMIIIPAVAGYMPKGVTIKEPAASRTTMPGGQASSAACMESALSDPPGERVRNIDWREGAPPTAFSPGFQTVNRMGSAGAY